MSIEALNWARKIYVGDSLAKSLLRAIADYADEHGHAWPSHSRLAADCEMSESTVKRRIAQLEEIGLVVTFRCWIDDLGRRNREQRGRETSRDIMLALGTMREPPAPTASESGEGGPDGGGGSDSTPSIPDEGVPAAPHEGPAAPPGGSLVTPLNEPSLNQKDSPQTPQAGGGVVLDDEAKQRFEYFLHHCLGWRTQTPDRAMAMFAALSEADQIACAAASPSHAAECTRLKKKSLDAWKLIRDSFWTRYPEARLPERKPDPVWIGDVQDLAALRMLAVITDRPPPRTIDDPERGIGFWRAAPVPPDLRALAVMDATDVLDWFVAEPDTRELNAWRHRLHDWTGQWIEPRLVMRRGKHLIQLPGSAPFEAQNRTTGIPVPWPFPPRKDGSIKSDEEDHDVLANGQLKVKGENMLMGNIEQVRSALIGITGVDTAPEPDGPDRYLLSVRMNREMDSVDSLRRLQLRSYWPSYEEFAPVRIVGGVRLARRTRRVGILPGHVFVERDPSRDFTSLLDRVIGAFDVVRTPSGLPLLIPDQDVQIVRKIEIGLNTPKQPQLGHGVFKVGMKVHFVDDLAGRWPPGKVIKLAREHRITVEVPMMGRKVSITALPHQIERT